MWLSLVERCVRDAETARSNRAIPTRFFKAVCSARSFFLCLKSAENPYVHISFSGLCVAHCIIYSILIKLAGMVCSVTDSFESGISRDMPGCNGIK